MAVGRESGVVVTATGELLMTDDFADDMDSL